MQTSGVLVIALKGLKTVNIKFKWVGDNHFLPLWAFPLLAFSLTISS